MDAVRSKLALTALSSRVVVFLLSVVSNALVPDHDAGVFTWTVTPGVGGVGDVGDGGGAEGEVEEEAGGNATVSAADHAVAFLTEGLGRWDGQYFLHIANNGYTYESTLAFFPLFPATLRVAGEAIHWLQVEYGLLHVSSALRLAGVVVNGACFVGACLALFELSRKVLRDDYLAYRAALLFCWNPASIFFSACYSECLCCLLTFCALLRLERAFSVKVALLFAAASACRANAAVNAGFVLYKGARAAAREVTIHRRLKQLRRSDLSETVTNVIGDAVLPALLSAVATLAPFVLFQWYAFTQFCGVTKPKNDFAPEVAAYADAHGLKMPSSEPSPWCRDRLPLPYSYIQSHYWGVGFLRYYQFRQLPNFLLAVPALYLVLGQCLRFFSYHRFYSLRLGCTYFGMDPAQRVPHFDAYQTRILPRVRLKSRKSIIYLSLHPSPRVPGLLRVRRPRVRAGRLLPPVRARAGVHPHDLLQHAASLLAGLPANGPLGSKALPRPGPGQGGPGCEAGEQAQHGPLVALGGDGRAGGLQGGPLDQVLLRLLRGGRHGPLLELPPLDLRE